MSDQSAKAAHFLSQSQCFLIGEMSTCITHRVCNVGLFTGLQSTKVLMAMRTGTIHKGIQPSCNSFRKAKCTLPERLDKNASTYSECHVCIYVFQERAYESHLPSHF